MVFARRISALAALFLAAMLPEAAQAAGKPGDSLIAEAATQDFSDGFGSLRTVKLEYRHDGGDTTVVVSPVAGTREAEAISETAFGTGVAVYHDWSDALSTRTELFGAEDKSPFAHIDLAQDISVNVAKGTTVTFGGRWARYMGGQNVTFASLAVKQYFRGISIGYRATLTKPDGQSGYVAHLLSLTLSDGKGAGRTQLWLSTGSASIGGLRSPETFHGQDRAGYLQRIQPVSDRLSAIVSAGWSSYDRPGGRIAGRTFALGLSVSFGSRQ